VVKRDDDRLAALAARLDRLMWTPTDVLAQVVTEDGLCFGRSPAGTCRR
jgi:hypothetical protein